MTMVQARGPCPWQKDSSHIHPSHMQPFRTTIGCMGVTRLDSPLQRADMPQIDRYMIARFEKGAPKREKEKYTNVTESSQNKGGTRQLTHTHDGDILC